LVGTLYPLALETLNGNKISVGAPYFNMTSVPLFIALLLFVPFGQSLAWKRGDLLGVGQRLLVAFGVAIATMIATFAITRGGPVAAPLGIGLGVWLIMGSATDIFNRCYRKGISLGTVFERAIGLPRSAWGSALAHAGMGITVIGISATVWGVETLGVVSKNEPLAVGPYTLTLEQAFKRSGQGYREDVARFTVKEGDAPRGAVETSKRIHMGREMPTTEAGIVTYGLGQLYASVNEIMPDGKVSIRFYWKPLVTLIWGGALVMGVGGALSLADRRARIAVSVKNRKSISTKSGARA